MNKRGLGAQQIAIVILLIAVVGLIALLFFQPDFSDEIEAMKGFVEVLSFIALGIAALGFLWKIKFFGLIK